MTLTLRDKLHYRQEERMAKCWTIKEFSKLTSVTVRTLQYYDDEDILKPHHKSYAGYRSYSEHELLCLQKINVLKYIGFNLKQIKAILSNESFDWKSSLSLQAKVLQENITRMQNGVILINDSLTKYSTNEVNWQVIAKILEVLKMTNNEIYQGWVKRNFSNNEVALFAEVDPVQNQKSNDDLWTKLFSQAKSLMHLDPSHPDVQKLAQDFMDSANSQYSSHTELRNKMWNLMLSGDIPNDLIPGYEKEIVVFMNKAIGILYNKQ